jgi:hypothetical protein
MIRGIKEAILESPVLQPLGGSFVLTSPPFIWKDHVFAGSEFGDMVHEVSFASKVIEIALDMKLVKKIWKINTSVVDR